jgi:hypothetical protein
MLIEKRFFARLFALLIASAAFMAAANASVIYRWVDDNGRTHIADTVPARYKDAASRVDTSASKVSAEQRAAALQRAEQARDAARKSAIAPAATSPAPSHQRSNDGRAEGYSLEPDSAAQKNDGDDAECTRLRREYDASQACFAQFATQYGIKGEAYQYCKSVPDPSPRCGLTTN